MKIKPVLNIGKTLQTKLKISGPLLMGGKVYEVSEAAGEQLLRDGLAVAPDATPAKRKAE